jgi:hypothetical protein
MPRDGSGVYTKPFPSVVAGTTIESTEHNGTIDDIALQLNGPIPVSSGGTGSSNLLTGANNTGTVSVKGAQTWTEAEKAQGRSNIYAAPLDALAYNGMQVNGSFAVAQESTLGVGGRVCDVWKYAVAGTSVITVQQVASPLIGGLPHHILITVPTAQVTMGGTDFVFFNQDIEGHRVARLGWGYPNPQSLTIAFWTQHLRTGTYSVRVSNFDGTRTCLATYTQNVSNAVEFKTVTFPGCPDGVWKTDNLVGISVLFALACGATLTAPSTGVWHNASYVAAPGQVNGVAATSDAFRITGVVVLPGIEAPSAARASLIMRPYDQELLTCQRYYRQYGGLTAIQSVANGQCYAATGAMVFEHFSPDMRAAPTFTPSGAFGLHNAGTGILAATGVTASSLTYQSFMLNCTVASGLVAGDATKLLTSSDINARLRFDARL